MQIPGVHIVTVQPAVRYTYAQMERACVIAELLSRGRFCPDRATWTCLKVRGERRYSAVWSRTPCTGRFRP